MMTYTDQPVWCGGCYRRVRFMYFNLILGGYSTWVGHDSKCPRFGKAPRDDV